MPMSAKEIIERIQKVIPGALVELKDLAGDNDHWEATVTSDVFAGMPLVNQHKLVYSAFGEDMGTVLHALAVKTQASGATQAISNL